MFNSLSNGINYRKNSMKPTTEMTIAELEIEMNRLQEEIRKANEENDVLNTQLNTNRNFITNQKNNLKIMLGELQKIGRASCRERV